MHFLSNENVKNVFYIYVSSPQVLEGAPDYSIDTVSEIIRQISTGDC